MIHEEPNPSRGPERGVNPHSAFPTPGDRPASAPEWRQERLHTGPSQRVAALLGWILFRTGLHRLLLRNRGIVVVFHRVDDRGGEDPITASSSIFAMLVAFFGKFFDVVPLSEMVHRVTTGLPLHCALAVTFDDGYLDNYTTAAPILDNHGVPACFFVVSDFIGSSRLPWWDQESKRASEWMTWDQIRELRARGHEIGAHTLTHVPLDVTTGDAARAEIEGSRARLEQELGQPVDLFAYPFGGRRQIIEENRLLVKQAGFRGCFSSYGGTIRKGDDPFKLRRTPITPWFRSPYQFGFDLLMGRFENLG